MTGPSSRTAGSLHGRGPFRRASVRARVSSALTRVLRELAQFQSHRQPNQLLRRHQALYPEAPLRPQSLLFPKRRQNQMPAVGRPRTFSEHYLELLQVQPSHMHSCGASEIVRRKRRTSAPSWTPKTRSTLRLASSLRPHPNPRHPSKPHNPRSHLSRPLHRLHLSQYTALKTTRDLPIRELLRSLGIPCRDRSRLRRPTTTHRLNSSVLAQGLRSLSPSNMPLHTLLPRHRLHQGSHLLTAQILALSC